MIVFDSIRDFTRSFDRKELRLWGGVYVGTCALIVIGIMVWHIFAVKDIQKRIITLNKSRATVQEILTQYQVVEQQKDKVAQNLAANKTFRIQKFFQELQTKYPVVQQGFDHKVLPNKYTEEKMDFSLSNIDTQQLCELLQEIEHQALVYVTLDGIDISKISHGKKINVKMSIATLREEATLRAEE